MKLKVYIIEDQESKASTIKMLLEKAYKNSEWDEYYKGVYVGDDAIEIIKGSEMRIKGEKRCLFYEKDKILDKVNQIINHRNEGEIIGISLDIKLTEEENDKSENNVLTCETARELYLLREKGVHICPMTSLDRFDENSQKIIGESVGDKYINTPELVDEKSESSLFKLSYFLVHGEMPTNELLNQVFGFD